MKICLIDGSGYIFRAFYGLPPLSAPDGTPVNAVYGFTNMFIRLSQKIKADYNLVLFDAKRKNFRNEIFEAYKANRKETPEELIPQFPIIREALDALNINFLEMEGYEADDLIATYAKLALEAGLEVIVVSADKDLMQLIRDGVEFFDPMKDKFFTPDDVKEKFGVYPNKVVDVQALSGDSTDNVPGVPGIGPKTAAELVNEYGSFDAVLLNAFNIKQNKRRETLLSNIENAKISFQLVKLKDDVVVEVPPHGYPYKCPSMPAVDAFIEKYALNTLRARAAKWVEQCSGEEPKVVTELKKAECVIVTTEKQIEDFAEKVREQGLLFVKTFNGGSNPVFDKIAGIALATGSQKVVYIPLPKQIDENKTPDLFSASKGTPQNSLSLDLLDKYLRPLMEDRAILKVGHNIKLDMHFINQVVKGVEIFPYDDVEVISYVLDSASHYHDLQELAEIFLDYKIIKNKLSPNDMELDMLAGLATEQTSIMARLYALLKPRLIKERLTSVYEIYDRPLIATLFEMEKNGIMVNAKELSRLSHTLSLEQKKLEDEIYKMTGEEFNLSSPKQVGEILYNKLGLKGKKNANGALQTGAEVLETMAEHHPLPQKILDWRAVAKLKSTYTDALLALLDKNNRIHTSYSQTVANTGRLSSNNPNLQNIPIRSEEGLKIRRCFVAKDGCKLISADYSQVELRLMAVIADVRALKEAFLNNIDIHTATAMQVFGLAKDEVTPNIRRHAKAINFGVIYGISQYGLAKQIGISSEEAKKYIDAYFAKMPEIKEYMEKTIDFAHKNGFVTTPFGRRCSVFGINDKNGRIVSFAERAAINAPLQGGAADIMKKAMNKMLLELRAGGYKSKILLQVHDEMVLEAPESEVEKVADILKNVMESVVDFDIKFTADVGVGDNWTEAH